MDVGVIMSIIITGIAVIWWATKRREYDVSDITNRDYREAKEWCNYYFGGDYDCNGVEDMESDQHGSAERSDDKDTRCDDQGEGRAYQRTKYPLRNKRHRSKKS